MSRSLATALRPSSAPPLDLERPLVRSRRFWSLLGAQSLGTFADNTLRAAAIIGIAAAWRAGAGPGEAFSVPAWLASEAGAWVGICFTLPIFVFSMISGQVAEKVDRHVIIRVVKVVEVVLMACAAVFFALGNAYGLLAFLLLMAVQSTFLAPTRATMMPQYYPGPELIRANGFFQAISFTALVAGLVLGGLLIILPQGRTIVAVLLVAAALAGLVCAYRTPAAPSPGLARINWNIPQQSVRMYREVGRMPGVLWPMLGVGWFWGVGALVLANLEPFVAAVGGVSADFGLLQAIFAIGAAVGSAVAGVVASRMRDPMVLAGAGLAGTILCAAAITAVSLGLAETAAAPRSLVLAPSPARLGLCALMLLTAACNGFFVVPLLTAVQARAPDAERGRVLGTSNMTNGGFATLFGLLVPVTRETGLTPITLFLAVGALQAMLLAFMWHRRRTHAPEPVAGPGARAAAFD